MTATLTLLAFLAISGPLQDERVTPIRDSFQPDPAWKPFKDVKDIWFDPKENRLVIRAKVALQDGSLEHLLCKKGTKEHESILATEVPARSILAGLLLTGAEVGHPVQFEPRFSPPTGTAIAIELEWERDGKLQKSDAREWVKDQATGAVLSRDWVFAGSEVFEDFQTKKKIFAADDGDLITVANFPAALLDLPYRSSANDNDRGYVARPDRVPVRGTPVTMYLKPRVAPPAKPLTKPATKPAG